ncbi:MAG: DUF2088 domain-containing protein [Deltaproteobacteria bacterium]|nr:DUF2088 domain-containing protein [Deltaproteobacteria bacterium]
MESEIRLDYGDQAIVDFIPSQLQRSDRFIPLQIPPKLPAMSWEEGLRRATSLPVGDCPSLEIICKEYYRGGDVGIIVDDYTRPNHHTRKFLPILLEFLSSWGVPMERVKLVIATGTHREPNRKEFDQIFGIGIYEKFKEQVVTHYPDKNNVVVGELDGIPVEMDRTVYACEIVVALTDIDNHYFAGVAGGPKAFLPGVAGERIITHEHLHMFSDTGFAENVRLGNLDNNPVFEKKRAIVQIMMDALRKKRTHVYTTACILDSDGDLVFSKGGEVLAVHKLAARTIPEVWTVKVRRSPDVVIAGAKNVGVNLYQAVKATHAAYNAVRPGGIILTAAPCPDSFGNEAFKGLMKIAADVFHEHQNKPDMNPYIPMAMSAVLTAVRADFRIGKQKPVDMIRILKHVGWGHLHWIADGLSPEEQKILPFVFYGDSSAPAGERLRRWVRRYLEATNHTFTVLNNPGYLVLVEQDTSAAAT